ncbi:MAG: zf-TFIIB domain-containing protein [Planctomycetota bacterium]|jgi:Zn-finger nucleic acid-binding protein
MALCSNCGNEVLDPNHCPICQAGRGLKRRKAAVSVCACPRCGDPLSDQDLEGATALMCGTCHGMFFPGEALEVVLNKLRATCDPTDVDSALRDFKDRFRRELPKNVRYKLCPVCEEPMIRRNYGTVSGVIIDVCYEHGTWADETAFAELASFIVRGGDLVADKAHEARARLKSIPKNDSISILGKLLGSD